jgi:hypothetical protein
MPTPALPPRAISTRRSGRPAWARQLGLLSLFGLGASALTSCCAYMACDGVNAGSYADVYGQFSADTLGGRGFTRAQVRQAYVVRYRDEQLSQPQDSLPLTRYADFPTQPADRSFHFALLTDSLPRHPAYRVIVAGQRFSFTHFSLEIAEEKPCHCLHLRNVHFTLNNQPTVVAQDGRQPVPVVLSR